MTTRNEAKQIVPLGLPAKVRIRYGAHRIIDRAGAWMCGHWLTPVAHLMWKACRMI